MEPSLLYKIGVTLIPGIGDVNGKKLIQWCGSAEEVFRASAKTLRSIPGIGQAAVNNILNQKVLRRAEEELLFIEKHHIKALFFQNEDYPQRLLNCYDHPLMLYYRGNADLNHHRMIAFVGTRRATDYGRARCREIIDGLRDKEVTVVSGLAYGIDGCSHRRAVELDIPTVGVLGHGLDRLYPAPHRKLAEEMLANGGLLTGFMSKTKPDRENFPKRNHIIAGMVDAIVVVESDRKGGALITAELANTYNRDVFAVPGRLTDRFSIGCNFLIKANKAALLQSADDIEYLLGWDDRRTTANQQTALFVEMSAEEKTLYELLRQAGTLGIDKLVIQSGYNPSQVAAALLNLEFNALIQSLPGKQYRVE